MLDGGGGWSPRCGNRSTGFGARARGGARRQFLSLIVGKCQPVVAVSGSAGRALARLLQLNWASSAAKKGNSSAFLACA